MTVIVGLVSEGSVFMGGDHAATGGLNQAIRKKPKVFIKGEIGIGYTGSFRMGDILEYSWTPPIWRKDEMSLDKYMCTVFVDSVRDIFKEKGFGKIAGDEGDEGGSFLVGIDGHIFNIEANYQVAENNDDFIADGSGWGIASGSLYTSFLNDPESRLTIAMEAASKFNAAVRAPFTIIEVKPYGENKNAKV